MGKRLQLIAQEGERVKSFLMVEVWPRQGWTALAPSSPYPFLESILLFLLPLPTTLRLGYRAGIGG